jgi:hypothetical protein
MRPLPSTTRPYSPREFGDLVGQTAAVVRVHAQLGLIPALRTSSGRWRILPAAYALYARLAFRFINTQRAARVHAGHRLSQQPGRAARRGNQARSMTNEFSASNCESQLSPRIT